MIEEEAKVIEVRGHRALVQTHRSTACEGCAAKGGCASLGGGRDARVWTVDGVGIQRGDRVRVAVPESMFLMASLVTYLLPVVALLVGAFVGNHFGPQWGYSADLTAAALGIAAMAGALFGARVWAKRRMKLPRIIRKVEDGQKIG